ncbi:MAG TPA: Wzz/FepE/Etk N-terminal domain-containing protein [Caulobacterales bacterium]|nr:Wzz/FepE/Etk N-terminal domain-containing protein [Caulobacterales bacterium]
MNIATYDPLPIARQPSGAMQNDELSLSGIVEVLQRRASVILSVAAAVGVCVAGYLLMQPPKYEATAQVMIDPRQDRVVDPQQQLSDVSPDSTFVDSQAEVFNSRHMAERLAQALHLNNDPEWNKAAVRGANAPLTPAVIERVHGAIDAHRNGMTHVIDVKVTARSAAKAALMANTLISLYQLEQIEQGQRASQQASAWLSQRLQELRVELNAKEAAAEAYRAQHGLLTAQGATLTEQQIRDAQIAVTNAQTDLAEKQARYRQVRSMISSGSSPDMIAGVISSETIRDLRAREADVARRQADMESRYSDAHPALQNVRAERADIERQIGSEIARISSSLESEEEVARARLASLQGHLAAVQGRLLNNGADQVQLNELDREAAGARAVYESFLQRAHEISDQGVLTPSTRLLSLATPPAAPASPKLSLSLAIAAILGLVVGLIAGMLVHQFDDTLGSADDVERGVGLPAVASIPVMPRKVLRNLPLRERHPSGYLLANPLSAFAEAFRVLRASIVYSQGRQGHKIVAVTSALPGEGKTTAALCLARVAAMSGEKVILIDCDVRRRSLNDILDIAPRAGLLEVLSGQQNWRSVIGRDEGAGTHVLPLSATDTPLHDVFGSPAMKKLMDELAAEYDLVVLDCAPVLAVAETRALVALSDMVILLGRWRKTRTRALASAIHQIEATGASVTGVALNCIDPRAPGRYSHSDSLYYVDAGKGYYNA